MSPSMKKLVPWALVILALAAVAQVLGPAHPREPLFGEWMTWVLITCAVLVGAYAVNRVRAAGAARRAALEKPSPPVVPEE
jgi:hypothetical protein